MNDRAATPLNLPIEELRSVGSRNLPRLKRLGVLTVRHLLWHFPSRYEDFTAAMPIAEVSVGQKVNIQGEVIRVLTRRIFPRRMTITQAVIKDQSGSINAVWFNQPYIANALVEGSFVSLAGKVAVNKQGVHLASPVYERLVGGPSLAGSLKHTSGLVPVYPETEGITSKYLRFLVKPLLDNLVIEDPLPASILAEHNLMPLKDAIRLVHYPENLGDAEKAKERLAFDDLLLFQLKALLERRRTNQLKSVAIEFDQELIKGFIAQLPFELTNDQKVAAWEILKDLARPYPMNRLLEGDVGSGKTVVALVAAVQTAARGFQTVFLAPTEVLATQHYATISALASENGLSTALLTATESILNNEKVAKAKLKEKITNGQVALVIGTHAVLQKDVHFGKLALVVIDEQHRFGIEQRAALLKSAENSPIPHLLSMTATPIPRTLALTIFGDLDISLIKEKPKNRQQIITKVVVPAGRQETYEFIRQEVKNGRQVFVICPRIESAQAEDKKSSGKILSQAKLIWSEVKAVQDEYERLSKEIFPDLKVAMLHGKLKAKEKQDIMHRFKGGWNDILVATSVVEVGVDIPNATVMMIESADRFGLAQLHQFRGRVGRDQHQSYCFLFTSGDAGIGKRLKALVDCHDGFELAEKDMAIRGPGEFFGIKQSGMPDLTMTALANVELIKKARLQARLLLKEDPGLTRSPLLIQRLREFQKLHHFE